MVPRQREEIRLAGVGVEIRSLWSGRSQRTRGYTRLLCHPHWHPSPQPWCNLGPLASCPQQPKSQPRIGCIVWLCRLPRASEMASAKHAYMNTQTMYHRCDHTCLRILVDAPSQMTKLFQFPHEDSNGAPPGSPLTLLPMDRLTVLFDILPAPNRIDWLCLQHTAQQTTFCASHAAPLAHPMDESPDG